MLDKIYKVLKIVILLFVVLFIIGMVRGCGNVSEYQKNELEKLDKLEKEMLEHQKKLEQQLKVK